MKRLEIEVSESIYDHILFFLNSLPKNLIHLSPKEDPTSPILTHSQKSQIRDYLERHQDIKAFDTIDNPVEWQRKMRDEWE